MEPQSPIARRVIAWLERGLPESALEPGEARRRSLLVSGISYLTIAACIISLPVILPTMSGWTRVPTVCVAVTTAALAYLALRMLRRGASPAQAAALATGIIFLGLAYSITFNGGLSAPTWILLPLVPVVATQMAGRRAGVVWSGLAAALVALLAALELLGVQLPRFTSPGAGPLKTAFYGFLVVIIAQALVYLSELTKDDAITRAVEASARLERADLEVERSRVLAQQAVAASAAKSAFMTTMSHELRTPLNAVIGYAELLVEDAEKRGLSSMRDDLLKVVGASHHLLGLIEDILDLSRVEADRIELRRERFTAQELVHEVCEALEPLAKKRKNTLHTSFDATPLTLDLDRGRLRQVLLNLIENAIKFTSQGKITALVRAETPHQSVVIEVVDTGIGIDAADHERIFEAFTQIDASPRRRYEGSGVGLSLCRRLVEAMDGTISVRSQLGRGSTFTVRLPAATEAAPPGAMDVAC